MSARRLLQVLGLAGLLYAIIFMISGGAREHHRAAAQAAAEALELRRKAAATSQIRPLDPAVPRARLPHELQRRVLGLYNSLDGEVEEGLAHAEHNNVHLRAELILNHLGLVVDLRDVNAPLLSERRMAEYRGVLIWFRGKRVKRPERYLEWLLRQVTAGRRVVALEGFGGTQNARGTPTSLATIERVYAALGLAYRGKHTDDPDRIRVVSKDSAMVEF